MLMLTFWADGFDYADVLVEGTAIADMRTHCLLVGGVGASQMVCSNS